MRRTSITPSPAGRRTTGARGWGAACGSAAAPPRSYYIGIESAMPAVPGMPAPLKALCVVPFGMEEGTSAADRSRVRPRWSGEPAEFRFLSSGTRKGDAPGTLVDDWGDEIEELSPLEVTLRLEGQDDTVLPVTLESRVTEVGTLELWCVSRDEGHRWKLELNIREHERWAGDRCRVPGWVQVGFRAVRFRVRVPGSGWFRVPAFLAGPARSRCRNPEAGTGTRNRPGTEPGTWTGTRNAGTQPGTWNPEPGTA